MLLRLLGAVVVVTASLAAAMALLGGNPIPGSANTPDTTAPKPSPTDTSHVAAPPAPAKHNTATSPVALLPEDAPASWDELTRSLPARVGLAIAPLGRGRLQMFGPLREGHAWSTIKVPILTTLLRERGSDALDPEEETWAREALTASDNEAAAALFARLEEAHGGLPGASLAVQETLRSAGDHSTMVATAPPPSGAVSTYGQTEWSLRGSVEFFDALGRGCLLDRTGTDLVLGLMEEVVPEQRWGLSQAAFPASWQVAMKGGWGPEGSAAGAYLVRQSGIVSDGTSGVAIAMAAQADSGTFAAGVEDLDRIAAWLAGELKGLGPAAHRHC